MGLREWGLAAILAISSASCNTVKEPSREKPSVVVDNYIVALHMKREAEEESDDLMREIKYEHALKEFQKSREYGIRPLDSMLQEADIRSILGDPVTALELADKVTKEDAESPVGFYVKGQIEQRHGYHAYAVKSFTTSIENAKARLPKSTGEEAEKLKSNIAEALWDRYQCHIALSVRIRSEVKILREPVEKALQDIEEYIQLRKDQPDGYIAKGAAQCVLEKAVNDKPHSKEAYLTVKKGIELIKSGKELTQKPFKGNKEGILKEFEEMKQTYEPEEKKEYDQKDF